MRRMSSAFAALAGMALLACIIIPAVASRPAQIMPLASKSLLLDIAAAGPRLVVVGERGHILVSDDDGGNWRQVPVPTDQMLTAVYFSDERHGWAVGHDGLILASDDAGASWRIQRDGLAAQQEANLAAREQALRAAAQLQQAIEAAAPSATDDLQLALEDALLDLEDADTVLAEPVFTSPLLDIWFQDRERGWAVGAFGTLLVTTDGGARWDNRAGLLDNPEEFHLNAITGDGRGRVFIAGESGVMYRSSDGGNSWQSLDSPYQGSWFGALYSARQSALLVFGLRGTLYRSTDFGSHWQAVASNNELSLAGGGVSAAGDIVLVGAVGTVLRSADGGLTFTRTMHPDRLSFSSGAQQGGRLLAVGQGGVVTVAAGTGHD